MSSGQFVSLQGEADIGEIAEYQVVPSQTLSPPEYNRCPEYQRVTVFGDNCINDTTEAQFSKLGLSVASSLSRKSLG
jgi:hypothetical protein